jgi:DNA-binding winged helix-turn-helix (wHTH) protein
VPRYTFGEFVLSPRRRVLLRDGREQPLIPRYFDLLVFLVERRHEAVHRREIFERVWPDVIVSDSALTQAIRTIRRTLADDPRNPRFIRTVSRHGYRFVFGELTEEQDDDSSTAGRVPVAAIATPAIEAATIDPEVEAPPPTAGETTDPYEPLIARITTASDEDDQQEAAELLHALGTSEALRRLGTRPHHAEARALLRDTRWEVAEAGAVPLFGQPGALAASWALVQLRLHRAARIVAARWASASVGGALAGAIAGACGGIIISAVPDSVAPLTAAPVLAAIGAACGAAGGAGVGAGLAAAEAVARSQRAPALAIGASVGGGLVGLTVQWLARWTLAALVGVHVELGGGIEGLAIGGAAGLGYAVATARTEGGLAAPRGWARFRVGAITALACGTAALLLTLTGRPLVGGTIHAIAAATQGADVMLTPLARAIGEPDFGVITSALIGTGEGAVFGLGLALGLTRRP